MNYYYPTAAEEAWHLHCKKEAVMILSLRRQREAAGVKLQPMSAEAATLPPSYGYTEENEVDLSGFTRRLIPPPAGPLEMNNLTRAAGGWVQLPEKNHGDARRLQMDLTGVDRHTICRFCASSDIEFDGYNNKNKNQPRYKCNSCKERYPLHGNLRGERLARAIW